MKINKLMLALAVAATTIAACNKQETTPQVENQPNSKSIVLNIANLATTKAPGTQIADNATQVTLNDYQVFFSDGKTLYTPYDETAENVAPTYFEYAADEDAPADPDAFIQFHFLDKNVNKVIVIGNIGEEFPVTDEKTTETELWAKVQSLTALNQQNEHNLVLYGSDSNLTTTDDHTTTGTAEEDQHPSPVYKAEVNIVPTVARFEIVGYEYAQEAAAEGQTAPDREYASVTVTSESLVNFYENATISLENDVLKVDANTPHVLGDGPEYYTWDNIYQDYFNALTETDKGAWYYDATNYTLTGETQAATTWAVNAAPAEDKDCYAYHVFPGKTPSFIFQLTALDEFNVKSLLYLQTKSLTNLPAEGPKAGDVYRMTVKFDDSVLRSAEKCIDVEITVHDWVVVAVTPEFK